MLFARVWQIATDRERARSAWQACIRLGETIVMCFTRLQDA
jgi:hypothetical protein